MRIFNEYNLHNSRLREGIKSNQSNWEDCTMYVQDLISPEINITVEITKEEADNFKEMCRMLAYSSIHIDACVLLSDLRLASNWNTVLPVEKSFIELSEASLQSLKRFKVEIDKMRHSDGFCFGNTVNTLIPNQENVLQDILQDVDEISKFSQIEMDQLLSCSKSRTISEREIINILSHLKTRNSAIISVAPFGSVTYGFGGQRTNFNILVDAGS